MPISLISEEEGTRDGPGLGFAGSRRRRNTGHMRNCTSTSRRESRWVSPCGAPGNASKIDIIPWPLLRLFTDGSPLKPLIAPGQTKAAEGQLAAYTLPGTGRQPCAGAGIRICGPSPPDPAGRANPEGNASRSRGVADPWSGGSRQELPGWETDRTCQGQGNWLSCTVCLHKAELLTKLRHLFDREGLKLRPWTCCRSELEYPDKIKQLCREPFQRAADDSGAGRLRTEPDSPRRRLEPHRGRHRVPQTDPGSAALVRGPEQSADHQPVSVRHGSRWARSADARCFPTSR